MHSEMNQREVEIMKNGEFGQGESLMDAKYKKESLQKANSSYKESKSQTKSSNSSSKYSPSYVPLSSSRKSDSYTDFEGTPVSSTTHSSRLQNRCQQAELFNRGPVGGFEGRCVWFAGEGGQSKARRLATQSIVCLACLQFLYVGFILFCIPSIGISPFCLKTL